MRIGLNLELPYAGRRLTNHHSRITDMQRGCAGGGDLAVLHASRWMGRGESLVRAVMGQMNLSARRYHRVHGREPTGVRCRAIADLAGCETVQAAHLAPLRAHRVLREGILRHCTLRGKPKLILS